MGKLFIFKRITVARCMTSSGLLRKCTKTRTASTGTETLHHRLGMPNLIKTWEAPITSPPHHRKLLWITSDRLRLKTAITSQGDTRPTAKFKTKMWLLTLRLKENQWIEHHLQSLGMHRWQQVWVPLTNQVVYSVRLKLKAFRWCE